MSQSLQDLTKTQLESISTLASVFAAGAERMISEASAFLELTGRNNSAWLQDLVNVRSVGDLIQVQTETSRAHYAAMIGQAQKIGAIYTEIAENALRTTPRPWLAPTPVAGPERKAA
jgi:hypothetical protein